MDLTHNGPNSLILAGEWAQATHQPIRRVLFGKRMTYLASGSLSVLLRPPFSPQV